MNPNNKTWQENAREIINLKNNPASNQYTINSLMNKMGNFDAVNVHPSAITLEDYQLLRQVTR